MTVFVLAQGIKTVHAGGGVKKWQNSVHVVVERPLTILTYCLKKMYAEKLNWPGRLAGISEGERGISKYFILDHFSPSFLSQKW